MASCADEVLIFPVLTQYKNHLAGLLASASGLSVDQTFQLIEERFDDRYDLTVAMMKIKKFKMEDNPATVAAQWLEKVCASCIFSLFPLNLLLFIVSSKIMLIIPLFICIDQDG